MRSLYENPDPIGRRDFFRAFAGEFLSFIDGAKGKPQCRLSELFDAPDGEIAAIAPALLAGAVPDGSDRSPRFEPGSVEEAIVDRIDGRRSLGEIATAILELGLASDEKAAFASCRSLFLELVDRGLCVPAGPGAIGSAE
jgi:hypothetical protein